MDRKIKTDKSMLTSVHLIAGAAIGKAVGEPLLTIPLAFFSHYALDAIPHYNPKPVQGYSEGGLRTANKKDLFLKSLEPIGGIIFVFYLTFHSQHLFWPLALGAFFGWLPDFLVFLGWKYKNKRVPNWHRHISFFPGIIPQATILLIAIWFLLK